MLNNPWATQILMRTLVKEDMVNAISTLESMPERVQEKARRALLRVLQERRVNDLDFHSVLDWHSMLDAPTRTRLVSGIAIAYAAHDPERAFAWTLALEDGEVKTNAMRSLLSTLDAGDPDSGKRLFAELKLEDPDLFRDSAAYFVRSHGNNDPRDGWRWTQSFGFEEDLPFHMRAIFYRWADVSPSEATRALLALRSDVRDQIAAGFGSTIPTTVGAEGSQMIFDSLESQDARQRLAKVLFKYYTDTVPDPIKAQFYEGILANSTNSG